MLKIQNHIHTFRRHRYKSTGNEVFFCIDAKCTFKIDAALALGKVTYCNRCNKEFKMDAITIRQAKPHCHDCDKRKIKDEDGNVRYIHPAEIVSEIAADRVESLHDRLKSATTIKDEDV